MYWDYVLVVALSIYSIYLRMFDYVNNASRVAFYLLYASVCAPIWAENS